VRDGGFGFDFKLGMASPEIWIRLLKDFQDDQ
jgi:hypothetical protein